MNGMKICHTKLKIGGSPLVHQQCTLSTDKTLEDFSSIHSAGNIQGELSDNEIILLTDGRRTVINFPPAGSKTVCSMQDKSLCQALDNLQRLGK
jgi:RIO-like serine/threonine protein kinase